MERMETEHYTRRRKCLLIHNRFESTVKREGRVNCQHLLKVLHERSHRLMLALPNYHISFRLFLSRPIEPTRVFIILDNTAFDLLDVLDIDIPPESSGNQRTRQH